MTTSLFRVHRLAPIVAIGLACALGGLANGATPNLTPAPAAHGASALVVGDASAQTVLGLPVRTSKGEDLGHVDDIVVDRSGVLMAAIIDFGGFLGVGSRKIAVDWRILHLPDTGAMDKLIADLPLNQLREAPVYKPGEPIVIMGAVAPPNPPSTPGAAAHKP